MTSLQIAFLIIHIDIMLTSGIKADILAADLENGFIGPLIPETGNMLSFFVKTYQFFFG